MPMSNMNRGDGLGARRQTIPKPQPSPIVVDQEPNHPNLAEPAVTRAMSSPRGIRQFAPECRLRIIKRKTLGDTLVRAVIRNRLPGVSSPSSNLDASLQLAPLAPRHTWSYAHQSAQPPEKLPLDGSQLALARVRERECSAPAQSTKRKDLAPQNPNAGGITSCNFCGRRDERRGTVSRPSWH